MHLPISGKAGDSTIIENIDGKRVIHHSQEYKVMTYPPIFEEQSALETYWHRSREGHAAQNDRASDGFGRAFFYVNPSPRPKTRLRVLPASSGVIRNASAPYSISTPDQPNSAPPKRDITEDGYQRRSASVAFGSRPVGHAYSAGHQSPGLFSGPPHSITQTSCGAMASVRSSRNFAFTLRYGVLILGCMPIDIQPVDNNMNRARVS